MQHLAPLWLLLPLAACACAYAHAHAMRRINPEIMQSQERSGGAAIVSEDTRTGYHYYHAAAPIAIPSAVVDFVGWRAYLRESFPFAFVPRDSVGI